MTKPLRLSAAVLLIVPAVGVVWFVLLHLWRLYVQDGPYSFGIPLRFGAVRIHDPVSDAMVLLCAFVALVCGIGVARDTKRRTLMLSLGLAVLAVVAVGVFGAA